MMKKLMLGALLGTLLFGVTAYAHPEIQVTVDGELISFDQPPVIIEDRTLVPMRNIFQALGCEVIWNEQNQSITSIYGNDVLLMYIGRTELYRNGEVIYDMPVVAQIVNDRTVVPVRAVSEALGAEVFWNGDTYEIDITSATSVTSGVAYSSGAYMENATDANGNVIITGQVTYPSGEMTAEEKAAYELEAKGRLAAFFAENQGSASVSNPYSVTYILDLTRFDGEYTSFVVTEISDITSDTIVDIFGVVYSGITGNELDLNDVVSDSNSEIEEFLYTAFLALAEEESREFNDDVEDDIEDHLDDVTFYLTDDEIGFYMPVGLIAPLDAGAVGFTVEYDV